MIRALCVVLISVLIVAFIGAGVAGMVLVYPESPARAVIGVALCAAAVVALSEVLARELRF